MVELEKARLKFAETEDRRNSLSLGYAKLEKECESLHNAAETLRQEKTEAVATRETEVTAIRTRFQNYRVCHRKKLCDFQINLGKAVNEFGVRCIPYPEKNSTIGEVVGWFDKEINVLPAAIAKVNKNFVCYVVAGVLWMLHENGCGHVEGLQTIMFLCDASMLEDLPDEIAKLTSRLVKKWWVEHGLPHITKRFCITPEVIIFSACCEVFMLC
jgi:hypothetical protein